MMTPNETPMLIPTLAEEPTVRACWYGESVIMVGVGNGIICVLFAIAGVLDVDPGAACPGVGNVIIVGIGKIVGVATSGQKAPSSPTKLC